MTANQVTIPLTLQQQHQIRIATGKSLTELNIDLSPSRLVLPLMSVLKIDWSGRMFNGIAAAGLQKIVDIANASAMKII